MIWRNAFKDVWSILNIREYLFNSIEYNLFIITKNQLCNIVGKVHAIRNENQYSRVNNVHARVQHIAQYVAYITCIFRAHVHIQEFVINGSKNHVGCERACTQPSIVSYSGHVAVRRDGFGECYVMYTPLVSDGVYITIVLA